MTINNTESREVKSQYNKYQKLNLESDHYFIMSAFINLFEAADKARQYLASELIGSDLAKVRIELQSALVSAMGITAAGVEINRTTSGPRDRLRKIILKNRQRATLNAARNGIRADTCLYLARVCRSSAARTAKQGGDNTEDLKRAEWLEEIAKKIRRGAEVWL